MSENSINYCSNCKHDIPSANYQIHSIHCKRNIQLCPLCDERIPRSEFENHKKEFHSAVNCEECNEKLENFELAEHKKEKCKKRILPCQHCDLELKADDIEEHEDYCGSRTEICDGCGRLVMFKFKQLHLDSNHKFIRLQKDSSDSDEDYELTDDCPDYYKARRRKKNGKHRYVRTRNLGSSSNGNVNDSPKMNDQRKKKSKSTRNYDDSSELNQYFQNLDLEQITNGNTSEINDILRREQSSANITQPEWLQETFIPCEFCDILIVADDLFLHQTGCRQDLTSFQRNTDTSQQSWIQKVSHDQIEENQYESEEEVQFVPSVRNNDEAIIPCEFCLQQFSCDDINGHQHICRRNNYLPF